MHNYSGYGATPYPYDGVNMPEAFDGSFAKGSERGHRKRMNLFSICFSLFLPVAMFTLLFTLMSSKFRYDWPWSSLIIIVVCFGMVLGFGASAVIAIRKKGSSGSAEPTWILFLFSSCLLAWLASIIGGEWNFSVNMQPYYRISNLNTYTSVDPAMAQGREFMDAGQISFTNTSRVNVARSLGFKRSTTYCVAPITSLARPPGKFNASAPQADLATYDFWAVGTDCCQSGVPNFHCGEFLDPSVHGGLRLVDSEAMAFYRLAVAQAEEAYNIKTSEPLFFTWMKDPIGHTEELHTDGQWWGMQAFCAFSVLQLVLVVAASFAFQSHM